MSTKDMIYEPSGAAAEYAHLALNLYAGCDNGCQYCYAPKVLRVKPEDFPPHATTLDYVVAAAGG